jgi:hypothetical protein
VSAPQQAMFFFFPFYTYLLIVSLQIANKYGIKKKNFGKQWGVNINDFPQPFLSHDYNQPVS